MPKFRQNTIISLHNDTYAKLIIITVDICKIEERYFIYMILILINY